MIEVIGIDCVYVAVTQRARYAAFHGQSVNVR